MIAAKAKQFSRISILDRFLKDKDASLKEYFIYEGIYRLKYELSQDFISSNPLRKCFDYDIDKEKVLNELELKFQGSQNRILTSIKESYMGNWRRVKEFMTGKTDIKDLGDQE